MFYIQKMLLRARFNSKLINGFIKKATHITNRENVVYITAIMIVWMCLDAACVPTTLQHLYVARWIINIDKYFTKHKHRLGSVLVCAAAHERRGAWFESRRSTKDFFPKIGTVAWICRGRRLVHPTCIIVLLLYSFSTKPVPQFWNFSFSLYFFRST